MTLLAPLALLGALIAIPVILLYMLRLRRREVTVSSHFLWKQILQDSEANTPWQRLRRNILLLLQLLILALLVLALARPAQIVPSAGGGRTVILLDASASMTATDAGGNTRFQMAQAEANRLIGEVGLDGEVSIIRVAETVDLLLNYTGDINTMRQAVNSARPGQGAGDWSTALTLAAAGAEGADDFRILIVSDGGLPDDTRLPANIPQPDYIPVGESSANLALTALATRSLPGQTPQLFAQVQNYSPDTVEVSLLVRLDGALWDSVTRPVSAGSQRSFVFDVDTDFRTIEAELVFDESVTDYLTLDNTAYTASNTGGSRRILLVSPEPNRFLEQVLRSLPGLQVVRGNADSATLPEQPFDLYIFNEWLPVALPDADMFIINPPTSTPLFATGELVEESVTPRLVNPGHPLATFLNVETINVQQYRRLRNTSWAEPVISAGDDALLIAGTSAGRQVVVMPLALRLSASDLPLQITWPLLVANALDWFAPANVLGGGVALNVGDTAQITPPLNADEVRITRPDGVTDSLFVTGETALSFAETHQPGLYTLDVLADGEVIDSQAFAVNLFGSGESNITPRETINVGGGVAEGEGNEQIGFHEWWPGLVLLALAVLLLEWYLYFQRLRVPEQVAPSVERSTARRR